VELELTDDQQLLAETTRRFIESSCPIATVRELADKEPAGYERDWWRRGAELGWTALLVPEELGGGSVSGHGLLDLALVAEELGRQVSPGPLLACNLVASALARVGTPAQQVLLEGLIGGDVLGAWCPGDPFVHPGPPTSDLVVRRAGDGYVLNGTSAPMEGAVEADHLVLTARDGEGVTQFLLPRSHPGLRVTPLKSLDLVRRFGAATLEAAAVPAELVLGTPGAAGDEVERQLEVAVVLLCAEMVGATDKVFGFTCEYAFDRYSFGRPLASYQALKHRFADMKLWLEACHATAGGCARAVDAGADNAGELISVAKSYIGDHAPTILQDCVQMHGGIGVTWDHDLHLYLRRVVQDRARCGTPADHRERIAGLIGLSA
jgi:alkylation response protein AidB-like acyl-CoA dehydrogenase